MIGRVAFVLFFAGLGSLVGPGEGSYLVPHFHRRMIDPFFWPDWDHFDRPFKDPFFHEPLWDPLDDDVDFSTELLPSVYRLQREPLIQEIYPNALLKKNDDKGLKLEMNVEGFSGNDLSLQIKGHDLIIKGHKTCKYQGHCCERQFCWRRTLPKGTDLKSIKATKRGDVLEIEAIKTAGEIDGEVVDVSAGDELFKARKDTRKRSSDVLQSQKSKVGIDTEPKRRKIVKKATKEDELPETMIEVLPEDGSP